MSKRLKTNPIDYTEVYCIVVRNTPILGERPEPLFVCKKSNSVFHRHFQRYTCSIFQPFRYHKVYFYLNNAPECYTERVIIFLIEKLSTSATLESKPLNFRIEKKRALCVIGQGPSDGTINQCVLASDNNEWPYFKFVYGTKENAHKITLNCYWSKDEYMKSDQ